MNRTMRIGLAAAAMLVGVVGQSDAALLTVEWAADGSNNGMGTGTLGGTTVTYTSAPGFNSGTTLGGQNWAALTGTGGGTDGAVTSQTGGVLGGTSTGFTQTIGFSSDTASPILLVNFLDGSDVFNFGANAFTLLDSNNATLASPLVIGSGSAADNPNDGFAAQFAGTFGPGTPLTFLFSSNGAAADGLQTVGFTVGLQPAAVPEPSTFASAGIAGLIGCGFVWRRRRRAA
jgi:hypothetical protein